MSKYVKNQSSTDPWIIDESGMNWKLGAQATIAVEAEPAIIVAVGNDGNTIRLKGDLDAGGTGSEGLHVEGDDTTVRIGKSSRIDGEDGIYNTGSGSVIQNAGTIDGGERGIGSDAALDIVNRGRISGDTAISVLGEASVTNLKGGVIDGGSVGIRISTFGSAEIVNEGRIVGDGLAIQVNSAGDSDLTNHGRIVGDIQFGAGNDRFDMTDGRIIGQVSGGLGHDTYVVGKKPVDIVENAGGGYDTVYAFASHALGDNFDVIWLSGDRAIDGVGNALDNEVHGNSGDNLMQGKGGDDRIIGFQGDDVLEGGGGNDHFVFRPGYGKDIVTDFDVAQEYVALLEFGLDSFDDVQPHISQKGDDTWISLGSGDRIILRDVDAGNLTEANFAYNIPM